MDVKLVIFDMDGVLVDSEPAIRQSSREALEEWGVKAELEDFRQFSGMGDDIFIGGVSEKYGVKYDRAMKKRAYEIYLSTAAERVHIYPWSKSAVESVFASGRAVAIASASDLVKVECNIACIGVDKAMFSAIITGSDVQKKKPAPDIFLKAAEKAGYRPENCVVIEDAVSGAMAAKAAGMVAVTVMTTFPAEKLREAGADYVLNTLEGLDRVIDKVAAEK